LAKLRAAETEKDFANASLLAAAISLAAQQKGSLAVSYKYAKLRAQMLGNSHAPGLKALALYQLANVERHCGLYDRARARNQAAIRLYEEHGLGDGLAMANMTAATDALWAGRYDMAPLFLERASELFWISGNEQMKPWVLLQEAWLRQVIGEPEAARDILTGLQQIGVNHGGVFRAGVEEHLLMVEADLGEWDGSASAWVNSTQFRRDSGIVQTSFERELSRKAKTLVKDRMGDSYLRLRLQQGPASF
jgi:tetratricopeptide (TPR) repeat protein